MPTDDGEIGINVGKGSHTAMAATIQCTGAVEVGATSLSACFSCKNIDSYDRRCGKMGEVDIVFGPDS